MTVGVRPGLVNTRHLGECPHAGTPRDDCQWCRWAVETPEVMHLLAIRDDARVLLAASETETIPGLVAAARLGQLAADVRLDDVRVPSARRRAVEGREEGGDLLGRLRRRPEELTRPGGRIERACRVLGGALVAAARTSGDEEVDRMSPARRIATMLPVIDARHWHGLPTLATQPEWSRRPAPAGPGRVRELQLAAADVSPGSIEALVAEAAVDAQTQRLLELGEELADGDRTAQIRRPVTELPRSSRSRVTLWRVARFDWHLSLVDSGAAACWEARGEGDDRVTEVPWPVAAGVECIAHLAVSAVHSGRPEVDLRDPATRPA